MPAITDPIELADAINDAASLILRWGHGQMRQFPATEVEMIVAALRAFARPEELRTSDFLTEVCDALFGCWIDPRDGADTCALCQKEIPIKGWVHAEHEPDCIINRVRDYLAQHKPASVRSWGVDWVPTITPSPQGSAK